MYYTLWHAFNNSDITWYFAYMGYYSCLYRELTMDRRPLFLPVV